MSRSFVTEFANAPCVTMDLRGERTGWISGVWCCSRQGRTPHKVPQRHGPIGTCAEHAVEATRGASETQ
jgi:hypothetical protein